MIRKSAMLTLATMALAGCLPVRSVVEKNADATSRAGTTHARTGQLITPKRCALQLAVLARPVGDRVLNDVLWGVADEQVVPEETRRVLAANGLRVAKMPGGLPAEVESLLHAKPPDKVEPTFVNIPNGEHTLFCLGPAVPKLSLILNRDDRTVGRDFDDASGFLRLTASHDGPNGVAVRIVPELHFGPIQHRFGADTNMGAFSVNQFVAKDSQEEETFRELAATLTLQPSHVLVVGCFPDHKNSLGTFLFTEAEANSDRLMQKVLFVWAHQTSALNATGTTEANEKN
jgi:hypothetical protein